MVNFALLGQDLQERLWGELGPVALALEKTKP
jgi:hypothetical protein